MYIFAFFVFDEFYVMQEKRQKNLTFIQSERKSYSVECLRYYWKTRPIIDSNTPLRLDKVQ